MTDQKSVQLVRRATADIISAKDVAEVWAVFSAAMAQFGMTHIAYGATRVPTWGIIGDGQEALVLFEGPRAYADVYLGEELYRHSSTYIWAEHNMGFASWAEVVAQTVEPPSPEQIKIFQLNIEHGCFAGMVGSLSHLVPGMPGVIGLSPSKGIGPAEMDTMWECIGDDVELLCYLMHLRIASLPQPVQRVPLTSRQCEVLSWFAKGKTTQDIATIMSLSIATVEKHLRLAREALGAQTTAHAVRKATSLNLLTEV